MLPDLRRLKHPAAVSRPDGPGDGPQTVLQGDIEAPLPRDLLNSVDIEDYEPLSARLGP